MNKVLCYESSFNPVTQCSQPDHYIPGVSQNNRPEDNFVISRRLDGSILSVYGDDSWLLWPYRTTATRPSPLKFCNFPNETKQDIKWIVFILIYLSDTRCANALTPGTLSQYMQLLKRLSYFSMKQNTTPCAVLGSEVHLRNYALDLLKHGSIYRLLAPLLAQIFSIGIKLSGMEVIDGKSIAEFRKIYRTHFQTVRQYAVIPSRIYSQLLTEYWKIIDTINLHKEKLARFIKQCAFEPLYARSRAVQYRLGIRKKGYLPFFDEAVATYGLTMLFKKFKIHRIVELNRFLTQVQHVCKELVHAYSGMRNNEALSLKIECLHTEKDQQDEIVHLLGETSKLIGQRKTTAWVTSIEIKKVIVVAKTIASLVANYKNFKFDETPLFVSVSYLGFGNNLPCVEGELTVNASLRKKNCHAFHLINANDLKIQEEDIQYLEKIDPLRAWRDEPEFQIGTVWKTTTHQWRRSLAFYVAQSGLVSLPTLKRQLQHITHEMSVYYSNGAGLSDLFNKSDHFMQELKKTKPEADALAYIYDVLLSDEDIKGAHGSHLKNYGDLVSPEKVIRFENRDKIIKLFRNGELAYKETALGACTSAAPCDKKLLRSLTACFSCSKAAIKASKVICVVDRQRQLVARLDDKSIEYQTEKQELEYLLQWQNKLTDT